MKEALALLQHGDYEGCLDAVRQFVRQDPAAARRVLDPLIATLKASRLPDDAPVLVSALRVLGNSYYPREPEEAEKAYSEAVTTARAKLGSRHMMTGLALGNLARIFWNRHDHERAAAMMTESCEILEATVSPGYNTLVTNLGDLAVILTDMGRESDASAVRKRLHWQRQQGKPRD